MTSFTFILTCFLSLLAVRLTSGHNIGVHVIGFPEKEENENVKNIMNRGPVFVPSMCPENQLLYPGDQQDDWICDCRPAHIYQSATDKCWPAYRQGPCEEGQYLVLLTNSFAPVCVKNPCQYDSLVLFKGKCQTLGSTAPCAHLYPNSVAVGVNATTLQVDCVSLNLDIKFVTPPSSTPRETCPPGSKRDVNQRCINLKT